MHESEKSDPVVVAEKPTNKAARAVAEPVEPRTGTKGNADQQSTRRAQDRVSVSQALERVRQAARQRKKARFTSLLHHIGPAMLRTAFYAIKRDAAPGVDGMTWETYEQDLDRRIEDLHERVKSGAYRALPSRRSYIPKEDGSRRPLAVAALEDKIVQRATAAVLSAIYEEGFLGFSYGFRPRRSQHDALDALIVGISSRKVNFILDADIRSFFTEVSQEWVVRFLEHRIGDKRIIRLVQKWLRAGVLEDGIVTVEQTGTGQGSMISPLLANVYLHYVFDLWAERWRRREATGDMIIVRYADDTVIGFEYEADARRFWDAMRERLREFSLTLHPDKTRLIEFGRHAVQNREKRGLGKPETFKFLGFVLICGKSRRGDFHGGSHAATAGAPSCRRSRKGCGSGGTCRSRTPGNGSGKSSPGTSPTTPCRRTARRSADSAITSPFSGIAVSVGAVRRRAWCGRGWRSWPTTFSPSHGSFILGRACALPSDTRGRSRVPELGSLGSVRGASSNERPYRENIAIGQRHSEQDPARAYVVGGGLGRRPRRRAAGRSVAGGLGSRVARRRPKRIALAIAERCIEYLGAVTG
jgi:group II intron reverse transcriptase/maturase